MDEQLTRVQAEECLTLVRKWLRQHIGDAAERATLHEPGFHTGGWSISLEEFTDVWPDGWPRVLNNEIGEFGWPEGVYAEPVNHWCLGLYVLWSPRPIA